MDLHVLDIENQCFEQSFKMTNLCIVKKDNKKNNKIKPVTSVS